MPTKWSDRDESSAVSPAQRRVLEDLYQRLIDHDGWPTYAALDHDADRHGVEDPLTVMRSLSPTYLRGAGAVGPLPLDQELSLSLRGLAVVAGWNDVARQDLELFAKSVQAAVQISDRVTPPEVARFNALRFLMPLLPGGPHVHVVVRLGRIWSAAGTPLWTGLSGGGTVEWGAELNQQNLRAYRPVRDVPSLLAVEKKRIAQEEADTAWAKSTRPTEKAPSRAAEGVAHAWVALLPDGFREAVAPKIGVHDADAINAGWIELADLIHGKIGLDLDGEDLVNQAFASKPPRIRLAADTKSGNNLHQGYTDLMRGLARMRNAQSHRGRPAVTELHVAATILAMGECFTAVKRAAGPP